MTIEEKLEKSNKRYKEIANEAFYLAKSWQYESDTLLTICVDLMNQVSTFSKTMPMALIGEYSERQKDRLRRYENLINEIHNLPKDALDEL